MFTDVSNLDIIVVALKNLVNWFGLGLQIGLHHPTLEIIEADAPLNTEKCKRKMLHCWLKKCDKVSSKNGPTCQQLIEALQVINEPDLVKEVKSIALKLKECNSKYILC